jgi:hypothetical protein
MDKWYYSWNGEKLGPVALAELQQLVEGGELEPKDLVWTSGMPEWRPAGTMPQLGFTEEPPPLPNSQAIRQVFEGRWEEALPLGARWLWQHKPVILLLGALISGATVIVMANMRVNPMYGVVAAIPGELCVLGLLIMGLISLIEYLYKSQRKTWLRQKWESSTGDGSWIQFSEDGGFVRNDGFGAKYTFDIAHDKIELRPVDDSAPVHLKVVLLSEKELAINWNGQTLHYQKPSWWKRVFG